MKFRMLLGLLLLFSINSFAATYQGVEVAIRNPGKAQLLARLLANYPHGSQAYYGPSVALFSVTLSEYDLKKNAQEQGNIGLVTLTPAYAVPVDYWRPVSREIVTSAWSIQSGNGVEFRTYVSATSAALLSMRVNTNAMEFEIYLGHDLTLTGKLQESN